MRLADLLTEHSLKLNLQTPSDSKRLAQVVSRCVPAEYLDPTPFLDPNVLLLTAGIGMNFTEQSVWDGYVERLSRVPVAGIAFAVGSAHSSLPKGLVTACIDQGIPLLEVPSMVPLLRIHQHVESLLQAEHFARTERGWALADECARLASQGAEISTLLAAVYGAVESPIAVFDGFGSLIAQYPESTTWRQDGNFENQTDVLTIDLPMGHSSPCLLAVRLLDNQVDVETLLTPAASILALQLNRSVIVDASSHQDMQRFVARSTAWSESSLSDVTNAFQELGLSRNLETHVIVADVHGENGAAAWKLRVALHDMFHDVRVTEADDLLIALAQSPIANNAGIKAKFLNFQPPIPLVLRQPSKTIDELRIGLVHALDLVHHVKSPTLAPTLGLSAIVAAAAGRGAREAAEKFMAALIDHDEDGRTELLHTLQVWLQNDAQPSRTCEVLFIHRNSLSYRLRRIEELLGISLNSLDARATCLMALRLIDLEPY